MMHKERKNPTYLYNYSELPEDRIGLSHRLTHCKLIVVKRMIAG